MAHKWNQWRTGWQVAGTAFTNDQSLATNHVQKNVNIESGDVLFSPDSIDSIIEALRNYQRAA